MNQVFTKCKHFELPGIFQQQGSLCHPGLSHPNNDPAKVWGSKWPTYHAVALGVNNRPIEFRAGIDAFCPGFLDLINYCMKRIFSTLLIKF
ncbi:hypothetical protein CA265_13385 [Sphingobacteriaceae bacterium GW460-11-11-14-LB5]|nr:hypothetical protein CA265_13385 [Sphingobacteriaceae bacterium GW460-11-11-14-LB5]